MDRVVLTSVVLGLVIRLLACKYVSKGFLNSFTYSPLDQWQSTLEGVFLRNEGLSTYNNDIVHQMPLELRFWSLVMSSSGEGSTICLLLMELMMVFSVPIFADICIKNILKLEEGNKSSSPKSLSMVLDKDKFQYARTLTIVWYCFNPYSVFSYAAQSTSIIWNIVNLWILITCCKGQLFLSACLCAIGCYLRLYPGYLLFPVIASAYNSSKSNSAVGRFIKILSPVGGFLIVLTGLMYASFILEDKSWAFISSVYIHQIRMADYTPQLGVYWYFFAEMFEHFEELFIWVFQILLASLVVGMTMRFHYDPTYLAWLITLITNVLQPYYCVGEFGYLLSVLFVWSYLRQYARMAIPTFCILLSAVVLAPLFHYMWLQPGVANANFYFAICMVHGVGHVTLVTDLLNSYTKREFFLRVGSEPELRTGRKLKLTHF